MIRSAGAAADQIDRPVAATDDGGALGLPDYGIGGDEKVGEMHIRAGYFAKCSIAEITRNRL